MQATAKKVVVSVESIKTAIAAKMDSASFTSWIAPLKIDVNADTISLIAQNQFSADFIKSVYLNVIESVARDFGMTLHIGTGVATQSVSVNANDNTAQVFVPVAVPAVAVAAFDNFVTSDENAFVV